MKEALLELICCPACQQALTVEVTERNEPEIWQGTLICPACQATYPVQDGMPHLYVNDEAWQPKAKEAQGWVTIHKDLGIYDVAEAAVDLKIPYYPEEPWIKVGQAFDIALETLALSGDELILDLGAGRGWASKHFAKHGCRVVALDVVPDTSVGLGRARALMDDAQTYFDRVIADGENLPFFDQKFDLVFCAAALHHSSHLQLLMRNIGRVLKPGGRLCAINEPCLSVLSDEAEILERDAAHELEVGINETRPDLVDYNQALEQAGLYMLAACPLMAKTMDDETLRTWARTLGAERPFFRQRPLRQQLAGWVKFFSYRLLALRAAGRSRLHYFQPQDERQRLEMGILLWVGGELFLLAGKPDASQPA